MTTPAVVFPLGVDRYAVIASTVSEVIRTPQATPVPTLSGGLLGVFNLRGEAVPLFDLSALLDLGAIGDAPFSVVVTTPLGLAGLAVGGPPVFVALDDQVAPSDLRGRAGVHRLDGDLVVVLDVLELLSPSGDDHASVTAPELLGAR